MAVAELAGEFRVPRNAFQQASGSIHNDAVASKLGFKIVAKATYKPTDTEFVSQVTAMKNAGADHVWLTTVPSATGGILGAAAQLKYAPQWMGQSPSWIGALAKSPLAQYLKAYMWVTGDAACDWGSTAAG